jgi:hypothetical protein
MAESLGKLTDATLQYVGFYIAAMLIGGIMGATSVMRRNSSPISRYDAGNLWSAWLLLMACGIGVVFLSVAAGLVGAGLVIVIVSAASRAGANGTAAGASTYIPAAGFSWPHLILLLGMIAVATSILATVAGVVQWSILQRVIDRPIRRWITGNVLAWTGTIVVGLFVGVMLGQVLGLAGLNGALFVSGLFAGGIVADKVLTAAIQKASNSSSEMSPDGGQQRRFMPVPMVAGILAVVPIVWVIGISASGVSNALNVQSRARATPMPTAVPTPNASAATYCAGVEHKRPSDSYVCIGSEPGDPVGFGSNWLITQKQGKLGWSSDGHSVSVTENQGRSWSLYFAAMPGEQLHEGAYENTANLLMGETRPILDVHTSGKYYCFGRFDVLVLEYEKNTGDLVNFAANFEQRCEGAGAGLQGIVRYHIYSDLQADK